MATYPFPVHLDRRFFLTGVHSMGTTTWTLPDSLVDDTLDTIVLSDAFGEDAGEILTPDTNASGAITLSGNYSAGEAQIGRSYEMSMQLSRLYRRDPQAQSAAAIGDRFIVHRVIFNHIDTGGYSVRVAYEGAADRQKDFEPDSLIEAEGEVVAAFSGNASRVAYFIESDDPRPVAIVSASVIGEAAPGMA